MCLPSGNDSSEMENIQPFIEAGFEFGNHKYSAFSAQLHIDQLSTLCNYQEKADWSIKCDKSSLFIIVICSQLFTTKSKSTPSFNLTIKLLT